MLVNRGFCMIQDDYQFYRSHQEEIVKDHLEEYVVIKDSSVLGYYKEESKAFKSMVGNELGTFIVKKCQLPGTDMVTYYNNLVSFA